jgi:hypothetical protein
MHEQLFCIWMLDCLDLITKIGGDYSRTLPFYFTTTVPTIAG